MTELVTQNGQLLIRNTVRYSGGKRSGSYTYWLKSDGTWTLNYSDASRFASEKKADKALIKVIKIYKNE